MTNQPTMPLDVRAVRRTPVFDENTIPPGLLARHQIAAEVWGRLFIHEGAATFTFDDLPESTQELAAGQSLVIPPLRPHHVRLTGPVRLSIEFFRRPSSLH